MYPGFRKMGQNSFACIFLYKDIVTIGIDTSGDSFIKEATAPLPARLLLQKHRLQHRSCLLRGIRDRILASILRKRYVPLLRQP